MKNHDTRLYIRLDVHKDSIAAAYADAGGGTPVLHGTWGGTNQSAERGLVKLLKKTEVAKDRVKICYEWSGAT